MISGKISRFQGFHSRFQDFSQDFQKDVRDFSSVGPLGSCVLWFYAETHAESFHDAKYKLLHVLMCICVLR